MNSQEEYVKSMDDYVAMLKRRKWAMIIPAFVVFALAIILAYTLPPIYQSQATILVQQQAVANAFVQSSVNSFAAQQVQTISQRVLTVANIGDIVEEYPVHLLGRVQETKPGINKWGKRLPSKKIPPVEGEKVVFHDGTTWRSGTALGLAPPRGCTSNATKSTVLNNQVTFFQGDITTLNVDAIQNAANDKLWSGGGICGAIFAAANDFELSRECSKKHPSGCPIGKTALTSGCQLHAKHVLHTVGPRGEKPALLESAYVSALEEAAKAGCDSVALCCISTGIFGYPPECAAPLAISTVRKWLDQKQAEGVAEKDMRVVFCLFLDSDVELYQHWMTEWFPR